MRKFRQIAPHEKDSYKKMNDFLLRMQADSSKKNM